MFNITILQLFEVLVNSEIYARQKPYSFNFLPFQSQFFTVSLWVYPMLAVFYRSAILRPALSKKTIP